MGFILFAIFAGVPAVEIAVFITVGGAIGLWPTVGVILLTAALGAGLLRAQGMATFYRAQTALQRGELPMAALIDGISLLFAGALLLTPGFVTDAVGFLLFVPPLRRAAVGILWRLLAARGASHTWPPNSGMGPGAGPGGPSGDGSGGSGPIIDGEFEESEAPPDDDTKRLNRGVVVRADDPC